MRELCAKRRRPIWYRCLLFLQVCLLVWTPVRVQGAASVDASELYAKSAVLMDGVSGRVLYEKNGYEAMPMASTTKIMTCLLAIEEGDMEQRCPVSSYAASMPEVHLGVREGEEYYLEDLLYALMLESFNDAAVIIAESIAGSVEEFAALMNQKAWELKCYDTHFVTPNGLDGADEEGIHATTARDLAAIMSYCIQNEKFCEITGTASWSFSDCSGKRSFTCNNHNAFLNQMEGAFSGKTGFTANAGYCYVGALRDGDRVFIVALLACGWPNNKNYKWSDTRKLMQYGLDTYQYREYSSEDIILEQMPVTGGAEAYVPLKIDAQSRKLLLRDEETAEWEIRKSDSLAAPVVPGMTVGYAMLKIDGEVAALCPIVTAGTVEQKGWTLWPFT